MCSATASMLHHVVPTCLPDNLQIGRHGWMTVFLQRITMTTANCDAARIVHSTCFAGVVTIMDFLALLRR